MFKIDDEVTTKVKKDGIPAGAWGVVSDIDEEGIWVDVYIPMDADVPEDTILFQEEELSLN